MKNFIAALMVLSGIILLVFMVWQGVVGFYRYGQTISSNWSLADRASTIPQKAEYVDKFVSALRDSGLQGRHDSLFFPMGQNSFDENFKALVSLQERLNSIKGMDENSFAYQTAIQQITEQEQGQADEMLRVFSGCWWQANYYYLWNVLILMGLIMLSFLLIIFGIGIASYSE